MAEYGKIETVVSDANIVVDKNLKVPQKDLLIFYRQLSVMLQSGLALAQGLELLSENMTNKKFAACALNISRGLASGEEFSICLERYPKVFKPISVGLIKAGEAGGVLADVLERIALLLDAQEKIKSQITGALIYPVLVLVLAVSVSLALLIFIVPQFKNMFDDMGAKLPALTSFMLFLSNVVTSFQFLIIAPITIFIVIYLFRNYYNTKTGRITVDRILFKIPLFGDLLLRSEVASFCDTLCTLMDSGVPITEGLSKCLISSSNQLIKDTITIGILRIEKGQELSYALSSNNAFPRLCISMIKIGEETGQLSFMLKNLADFYKRELETAVSALTKAMEPTVIVVVAGIVGTIVISLYLPMFGLINNMGN